MLTLTRLDPPAEPLHCDQRSYFTGSPVLTNPTPHGRYAARGWALLDDRGRPVCPDCAALEVYAGEATVDTGSLTAALALPPMSAVLSDALLAQRAGYPRQWPAGQIDGPELADRRWIGALLHYAAHPDPKIAARENRLADRLASRL